MIPVLGRINVSFSTPQDQEKHVTLYLAWHLINLIFKVCDRNRPWPSFTSDHFASLADEKKLQMQRTGVTQVHLFDIL